MATRNVYLARMLRLSGPEEIAHAQTDVSQRLITLVRS